MIQSQIPWYREPWPWLLMAGPALVVMAGFATAWLALINEDGIVADDYYKQGLAINTMLRREAHAAELKLRARIWFGDDRVRIHLIGAAPVDLGLQLVHPTRAGLDRAARLKSSGAGWYEGAIDTRGARWKVVVEDTGRTWRLGGEWNVAAGSALEIDTRGGVAH